jgi:hypothetical protein
MKPKSKCFYGKFNIVSLSDWHVPFEDGPAVQAALNFIKIIQPQIIIIHELHDFYALSRFDKNPARIDNLQSELDKAAEYLQEVRRICPHSRIILLKSNHLDRLRRYLWSKAQGLCSLRALELETLLELDKLKIDYMDSYIYGGIIFKHGNLVSVDAGMTARRELQAEGLSGVSGHTHRLAQIYRRERAGTFMWIENGCLCDLQPEYIEGVSNWQHGLSIVSFEKDRDAYFAIPIPIVDGKILFRY